MAFVRKDVLAKLLRDDVEWRALLNEREVEARQEHQKAWAKRVKELEEALGQALEDSERLTESRDERIRLQALDFAIRAHRPIQAASVFETYLKTGTAPGQVSGDGRTAAQLREAADDLDRISADLTASGIPHGPLQEEADPAQGTPRLGLKDIKKKGN